MRIGWLAPCALLLAVGAAAAGPVDPMAAERAPDLRLATLTDRLATAAVARCADRQGRTGLVLHTLNQYAPADRASVAAGFGLSDRPAVLAIVPGSPAEVAGVQPDDTLLAADGEPMPNTKSSAATFETAAAAADVIDKAAADGEVTLTLSDAGGQPRSVTLATPPICRVRPVVTGDTEARASTDGVYLKVSRGLLAELPDDELSAALAHEFAHILLRHPQAIRLAGGRGGLFAPLNGRGARVRRTEEEADRLSVALLAEAGLDPTAAVRLWQGWGRRGGGGLFGDPSHGGWDDRVAILQRAIAALPPTRPMPISSVKETTNGE